MVVTGASGHLARRTAELVLERVVPEQLVLVTRSPEVLSDLAAQGVQVRAGDFDDPDGLVRAFAGGERMLLVSATDLGRRVQQHQAAIRAAAAAGVRHVVYTSVVAPTPANPAAVAPSHRHTEVALRASGLAWTFLRNSLYAEYQAPEAARALQSGRLVHNRGTGRAAYVSREDCAAAAAAVLATRGHEEEAYDITGPELLSAADLASLYAELGGRPVVEVAVDDERLLSELVGGAEDDDHLVYGAGLVVSFGRAIREGHLAVCSDAVATLTGQPPRSLRDVLAAEWKGLRSAAGSV